MIHVIDPFAQANATWLGLVRGSGEVAGDGHRTEFGEHTFMFISKGVRHQHINTGHEPLWPSSTARTATCPST